MNSSDSTMPKNQVAASSLSGSELSMKNSSFVLDCNLCKCDLNQSNLVQVAEKKLCKSCFEMQFSKTCNACKKLIRLNQKVFFPFFKQIFFKHNIRIYF